MPNVATPECGVFSSPRHMEVDKPPPPRLGRSLALPEPRGRLGPRVLLGKKKQLSAFLFGGLLSHSQRLFYQIGGDRESVALAIAFWSLRALTRYVESLSTCLNSVERWSAVNLSNEVTTPVCSCAILARRRVDHRLPEWLLAGHLAPETPVPCSIPHG